MVAATPVGAWPRILVNDCVGVMLAAALGLALLLLLLLLPQPATTATATMVARTTAPSVSHLAFFMLSVLSRSSTRAPRKPGVSGDLHRGARAPPFDSETRSRLPCDFHAGRTRPHGHP